MTLTVTGAAAGAAVLLVDESCGFSLFKERAHAFLLVGGVEAGAEEFFFKGDGLFDEARLNALPAVEETDLVRHVRLDSPLTIKVDGIHREAVVML